MRVEIDKSYKIKEYILKKDWGDFIEQKISKTVLRN